MLRKLSILATAVPALFATTVGASAQTAGFLSSAWDWCWGNDDGGTTSQVPEIDASTGLLAMAAIGAALILSWEMKRRRA